MVLSRHALEPILDARLPAHLNPEISPLVTRIALTILQTCPDSLSLPKVRPPVQRVVLLAAMSLLGLLLWLGRLLLQRRRVFTGFPATTRLHTLAPRALLQLPSVH